MSPARKFLMLGPAEGWHATELRSSAESRGHTFAAADYESLAAACGNQPGITCQAGEVSRFDAVLTRTMPRGTLEQITFRLTALHQLFGDRVPMINPPRGLELAIDKFHTLAILDRLGFPTPPTRLAQSRDLAMAAFEELGQDCVVKPLFGGEGRGVMRVADKELAWYTFSSLEQLGAVIQVQKFIAPGGRDTRLLVIGDNVFGIRRQNDRSFRSNVAAGAKCTRIDLSKELVESAKTITRRFGLHFASVDLIDNEGGPALFLEVNAVPGWKGAQRVLDESIADCVVETLERLCEARDD